MTYDETTLFRRFLTGKGMLNNFEYLYKLHRFSNKDVLTYYDDVEAESVIMSAFDFSKCGNTIFNYQYWKDLNAKWVRKLDEFHKTGKLEAEESIWCKQCGRLMPKSAFAYKSNGTLHKHCKECESGAWARQQKEIKEKERAEKAAEEAKAERELEVARNLDYAETLEQETESRMPTSYVERQVFAPKLGEYDATLHYKESRKSITLNAILSEVVKRQELSHCYLNIDRGGKVFLIFNRVEGSNVTGVSSRSSMLLGVNSSDICKAIAKRFGLRIGYNYYLHISRNKANVDGVITIEVIAVRTQEEYAAIVERREKAGEDGRAALVAQPTEQSAGGAGAAIESPDNGRRARDAARAAMVSPETEEADAPQPLIDFITEAEKMKPEEILDELVKRDMVTVKDMATYLFRQGWKLQKAVTTYEEFTL